MRINLSPIRSDAALTVVKSGDALTVNGATFDFAALQDGAVLPRDAVECEYLVSDVIRTGGQIELTLMLPIEDNASEASRFPAPISNPPDGPLEFPL